MYFAVFLPFASVTVIVAVPALVPGLIVKVVPLILHVAYELLLVLQLNVPAFDDVIATVALLPPTYIVPLVEPKLTLVTVVVPLVNSSFSVPATVLIFPSDNVNANVPALTPLTVIVYLYPLSIVALLTVLIVAFAGLTPISLDDNVISFTPLNVFVHVKSTVAVLSTPT